MFDSVKNKIQKSTLMSLLQFIVSATSEAGHGFAPEADAQKLLKAEPTFIVIDSSVKNDEGMVKVTATQTAIDALNNSQSTTSTTSEAKAAPAPMNFEIVTLTELPEIKRGGHKADNYPFDKLTVFPAAGNAFFVPATEGKPNPAKSLASTVASATKRYKGKGDRVFTVRKHADATGKILGAHVIRTA